MYEEEKNTAKQHGRRQCEIYAEGGSSEIDLHTSSCSWPRAAARANKSFLSRRRVGVTKDRLLALLKEKGLTPRDCA